MSLFGRPNFGFQLSDPKCLYICQWQQNPKSPENYYLVYRFVLLLYFNAVVILSLVTAEQDKNLVLYPIFLTNWNVIINGLSSILLFVVTLKYRKTTENEMSTLLKVAWLTTSLSTVLAISLSIIYWPLIYTGRDKGVNDALTHAGNAIVLLIDLFISAHPPRFGHFVYHLLFGLSYILFSIIYTFSGGVNRDNEPFIYTVLDWKNQTLSTTIFAMLTLLFLIIMHFVLTALILIRLKVYGKIRLRNTTNGTDNSGYEI